MSQTITSSDLIPNEIIMNNKMELFSWSTFLLPVVASCAADTSLVAPHPSCTGMMDRADSLWISCLPTTAQQ